MLCPGIEKRPFFQNSFGIVGSFVSVNKYPIAVHEIASKSRHTHLSTRMREAAKPRGRGPRRWADDPGESRRLGNYQMIFMAPMP